MNVYNTIYNKILLYEQNAQSNTSEKISQHIKSKGGDIKGPIKCEICLTNRCNQKCIHCSNGTACHHLELNVESVKRVLEFEPITVILTGGEPFLHPDILTIISTVKKTGSIVKVCTNGTMLTYQLCKELDHLLDNDDVIQISFDAANEETYERIRGTKAYSLLLENIQVARETLHEANIELHCVPSIFNINQILQIYRLAAGLKANYFSTAPLAYLGRANKEYQADILSLLSKELLLYQMSNSQTKYVGRLFETCSLYGLIDSPKVTSKKEFNTYRCDAGIFSIYIDCTENIYPCVYLKTSDYCLGTLHDSTQAIVDTSKILFGTRIPIAGSNCDGCYLWPYCNGGCIGIAYSFYGIAKPGFDPRCGRFNKDR